jgi:hypothetical protein
MNALDSGYHRRYGGLEITLVEETSVHVHFRLANFGVRNESARVTNADVLSLSNADEVI